MFTFNLKDWFGTLMQPGGKPGHIDDWIVFKPGFWNGRYYSGWDCQSMVNNFQLLSTGNAPRLRVKAKIGHNPEQRIAKQLGFPACGNIVRCELGPADTVRIWITDIPVMLAKAIREGQYKDGSVEMDRNMPDPRNPSVKLPGLVLTGIAFLGEELPGVQGLPIPVIKFSASQQGNPRSGSESLSLKFSEYLPPMKDQLLAQLSDYIDVTDDIRAMDEGQLQSLLNVVSSPSTMSKFTAKYKMSNPEANSPAITPVPGTNPTDGTKPPVSASANNTNQNMSTDDTSPLTMASFTKCFSDAMQPVLDRIGGLEKQSQAKMSAVEEKVTQSLQFAADYSEIVKQQHRQRVEGVVDQAVREGRLAPALKADMVTVGLSKSTTEKQSANNGLTPFDVWQNNLLSTPVSVMFSSVVGQTLGEDGADVLDERTQKILANSPRGRAALEHATKK